MAVVFDGFGMGWQGEPDKGSRLGLQGRLSEMCGLEKVDKSPLDLG